MIRFLLRAMALFALAAGFVALVLDGTRSIAANRIAFLDVAGLAAMVAPQKVPGLRPAAESLHPLLWDPGLVTLLGLPACLALVLFGALLLLVSRRSRPEIGYSSRP